MLIKKETPVGTLSSKTTDIGLSGGMFGYMDIYAMQFDQKSGDMILYLNTKEMEKHGVVLKKLDDWDKLEEASVEKETSFADDFCSGNFFKEKTA